jgi:hypothetical protein
MFLAYHRSLAAAACFIQLGGTKLPHDSSWIFIDRPPQRRQRTISAIFSEKLFFNGSLPLFPWHGSDFKVQMQRTLDP